MTFLYPLALAVIALGLPLFAAYLWRKRIEKRRVPSVILLRAIAIPTEPPRRGVSRPRHLVSFALVVLGLLAAALAISDIRRKGEQPRDLVVVLDTSASMGARDEASEPTRLEQGIADLEKLLSSLHGGDRVALVTTGDSNAVRVGLTEDYAAVIAAAKSATPGGTSDRARAAIELADGICAGGNAGRVVVISDGVGVSVPETKCEVGHLRVGGSGGNAGISELSVRESDALGTNEIHVAVTSSLGRAKRAEIAILAGDTVIDLVAIDLPARGKVERLLRMKLPEGSELTATLKLSEPDALPADDTATVPRVEGGRVPTLLVTPADRSFVGEALRLHPRVDLTVVKPTSTVSADAKYGLIVLEAMPAGALPEQGSIVSFGMPAEQLGLQAGQKTIDPEIVRWAFQDPLFRYVDLQGVKVPSGEVLAVQAGQRTLIDTEQGALAVLDAQQARQRIFVGFAPHESDFVLRVGFVNFMANVVDWASKSSASGKPQGVLSDVESFIDPPSELAGADVASRGTGTKAEPAVWRTAIFAAFALLVAEQILQTLVGSRHAIRSWIRRVREGMKAKSARKDDDLLEDT